MLMFIGIRFWLAVFWVLVAVFILIIAVAFTIGHPWGLLGWLPFELPQGK